MTVNRGTAGVILLCTMICGLQLPLQSLIGEHRSGFMFMWMTQIGLAVFFSAGPLAALLVWIKSGPERRTRPLGSLEAIGFELAKRAGYRLWCVPVLTDAPLPRNFTVGVFAGQMMVSKRAAEELPEPVIRFGMALALARSMETFLFRAGWILFGLVFLDIAGIGSYVHPMLPAARTRVIVGSVLALDFVFFIVFTILWKQRSASIMRRALEGLRHRDAGWANL